MEEKIRDILVEIGEDPEREGLKKTPSRVAEAYRDLTAGYRMDLKDIVNKAIFHEDYDEMVLVKNIDVFSLCEHHMLPFFGMAHVAYIPDGRIIGVSKISRIVEMYARRLQVQERMTDQIAHTLMDVLKPRGVGVIVNAQHLCMVMRGIKKINTVMTTSSMLGIFKKDPRTRSEFLSLVNQTKTTL